MKKINALLLVLVMIITMSGFENVNIKADEEVVLPEYSVTGKVTKTQISKPLKKTARGRICSIPANKTARPLSAAA